MHEQCTFGLRRVLTYTHNVISEISIIVLYISIFLEKKKEKCMHLCRALCVQSMTGNDGKKK